MKKPAVKRCLASWVFFWGRVASHYANKMALRVVLADAVDHKSN